ncbi:MAG: hypothetical protein AB7Y74_10400 [Syntrophorhabdus sp.]
MNDPSHKLAANIVGKFVAENLISNDEQESMVRNLASGKISAEDWKVIAEKALMEKERATTTGEEANATQD